jgi:hypothetical protein
MKPVALCIVCERGECQAVREGGAEESVLSIRLLGGDGSRTEGAEFVQHGNSLLATKS